jgi:hypothetical protein
MRRRSRPKLTCEPNSRVELVHTIVQLRRARAEPIVTTWVTHSILVFIRRADIPIFGA